MARQHSKSIPDKNLQEIGGVSLLARSVRTALATAGLNRVLVSTDGEDLARVAMEEGAEVPFLRPRELSRDDSTSWDVVRHAWEYLEQYDSQGVVGVAGIVLLQPTSPYLWPASIDGALREFQRAGAPVLKAVRPVADHPTCMLRPRGDLLVRYSQEKLVRRKELSVLYYPCGAIYIYDRRLMSCSTLDPNEPAAWIELNWPESMDIDDPEDLLLAQTIATHGYETETPLHPVP